MKRSPRKDEKAASKAGRDSASVPKEGAVRQVRQAYGVNRRIFSRLASFSERSIAAWESGEKLSGPGRQRIAELHRLQEALAKVMDSRSIAPWLETPNPAFHQLKPLEVIERGEIDRIWRMIFELQSGVPG